MANSLEEIVKKYNLNVNLENDKFNLNIAFLGEFNSGKSSLINFLLSKNILPTKNEPTTKRIILIEGKDINEPKFYIKKEEKLEEISLMDFWSLNTAPGNTLYIEFPANEFFQKDFLFIDTPGISSIDEKDFNITLGYLPFVDGAVFCIDVNIGSVNDSLKNFIIREDVKHILKNALFVITKCDEDKLSLSEIEKVKEEVINQLELLNREYDLNINEIKKRVVTSSKSNVSKVKEKIKELFFNKERILLEEKTEKKYQNKKYEIVAVLKDLKNTMSLDTKEIDENIKKLKDELIFLSKEEQKIYEKLDRLEDKIFKIIKNQLLTYLSHMQVLEDKNEITVHTIQLQENIKSIINNEISRQFKVESNIYIDTTKIDSFGKEIEKIFKYVDMGKIIGTAVLMAAIGPAADLEGNVAEFVGGAVLGTLEDKSSNRNSSKFSQVKAFFGEVIKHINPIDIIGEIGRAKWIETLEKDTTYIANEITMDIIEDLKNNTKDIFEELKSTREEKLKLIQEFNNKKLLAHKDYLRKIEELDKDIKLLEKGKI